MDLKIGQLVYDEYSGLGTIIDVRRPYENYTEYKILWVDPEEEISGWWAEEWVGDWAVAKCLTEGT